MGKINKYLALSLFALGFSSQAFAYSCVRCGLPFEVSIPNQQGGFSAAVDAFTIRPVSSDLFATVFTPESIVPTEITAVNATYNWAFDLSASYRFPHTGNDISATWTHIHQSNDNSRPFDPGDIQPIENFLPNPTFGQLGFYDIAGCTVKYPYDAVDVNIGQRVNLGCPFVFRFFSGIRWASIEHEKRSRFESAFGSLTDPTTFFTEDTKISNDSVYRGLGPQVGFDAHCGLIFGFGLHAGSALSLLIGHTEIRKDTFDEVTVFTNNLPVETSTAFGHVKTERVKHVVPAIDVNPGVDYTYNFYNCARSSFVIQVGYKVIRYFGASQFAELSSEATGMNHSQASELNTANDVSFDGPYAGLKINL